VRLGFALLPVLRPLLRQAAVRDLLKRLVRPGPGAEQRAQTVTHVWGEVRDEQGRSAAGRVHGPEAGVIWTIRAALAAVRRVLSGSVPPGFQTPAMAFGPDFVLEAEGVTIEDLE
jgi:saccharopine dehydrogenase (NAD+, L-lysine-forming)